MKESYTCPVCGYDKLRNPAEAQNYNICSRCRTEFGLDDDMLVFEKNISFDEAHAELRKEWIKVTGDLTND